MRYVRSIVQTFLEVHFRKVLVSTLVPSRACSGSVTRQIGDSREVEKVLRATYFTILASSGKTLFSNFKMRFWTVKLWKHGRVSGNSWFREKSLNISSNFKEFFEIKILEKWFQPNGVDWAHLFLHRIARPMFDSIVLTGTQLFCYSAKFTTRSWISPRWESDGFASRL